MKHHIFSSLSLLLLILQLSTLAQAQTATAPAPSGPTNITKILEKAGQFTTLIRLMKVTQVGDQINTQLNNSNQGMTVFAPTDNAFSNLKSGTINSLSAQQQVQLVQFHVLPNFISMAQFQTVSNPLRTQAGDASPGDFPLNVTTSGNQVNVSTGVDDATVSNTIYTDGQLAVYQVDKVLQPMSIFAASAPAMAPAPATLKSKRKSPAALSPSSGNDDSPADDSGAESIAMHAMAVLVIGVSLFVFWL
ncbi:PREDICTED: fasciclin-like arabinogalactan protein 12 [Nicotiana attenuata]|uniref:Fasciclin-like arabinogalactan protein 12 n=1 Tax=Nicotiana attenuata TaxID=49451 RepID=A0A1J6K653_NICAT|nr:PREDICTED: fasciclin-like arabinogalactan protein 12 [Nicotiana attenuata]OIT25533.1 fasciclin-like arabinogalactan protein 12 [Nicotiana attenuata]